MFRERSLRRVEGSIRERKAEAYGNEVSGLFLAYLCTCGTKCVLSGCRLSSDLRVGSYKNAFDTPGVRHIWLRHNLGNRPTMCWIARRSFVMSENFPVIKESAQLTRQRPVRAPSLARIWRVHDRYN